MIPDSIDRKEFQKNLPGYNQQFEGFLKTSQTPLHQTARSLWQGIAALQAPFFFDADADMAKFTFGNGRSVSLCTSVRRFHRPKKTGKPLSMTVILGGFRNEYDDPENQLVPCDQAGKIDCCYFGMGEDEEDLATFYIGQLIKIKPVRNNLNLVEKARISPRRKG